MAIAVRRCRGAAGWHPGATHRGPVRVVGGDMAVLREPEDALLEDQFRVTSTHVVVLNALPCPGGGIGKPRPGE